MTEITPELFHWNYCPKCGAALAAAFDGEGQRPHCKPCNRFYYSNPVPAVAGILLDAQGNLLLSQRAVQPCKGLFSLPGGFVENGESAEEALCRELEEETGLRPSAWELQCVLSDRQQPDNSIILIVYHVTQWSGALHPEAPGMDIAFYAKAERPEVCFRLHQEVIKRFEQRENPSNEHA